MKKMIALLMILALLCGAAFAKEETFAAPGNDLGFDLLQKLYAPGENTVLSPISLRLALGMAAAGAQGETLEQLRNALGEGDLSGQIPAELKNANAAFVSPGLSLNGDYIEQMNADFSAEWFEMDGEVVSRVNAWVNEKTDGLIPELLKSAPAGDTGLILLNAVALDAKWVDSFSPETTYPEIFHTANGEVEVEMMHQTATFDYVEKHGMQIVRLPYAENGLSMWIVLPGEEASVEMALNALEAKGMPWLSYGAEPAEVQLALPKLDVQNENGLSEALKALGVELPFTDAADFSGISATPLCIGDVLQNARIQIDEDGTRAAAATAVMMKAMGAPVWELPIEMRVDHPFAFVIADAETGSVCFAGAIENPLG